MTGEVHTGIRIGRCGQCAEKFGQLVANREVRPCEPGVHAVGNHLSVRECPGRSNCIQVGEDVEGVDLGAPKRHHDVLGLGVACDDEFGVGQQAGIPALPRSASISFQQAIRSSKSLAPSVSSVFLAAPGSISYEADASPNIVRAVSVS